MIGEHVKQGLTVVLALGLCTSCCKEKNATEIAEEPSLNKSSSAKTVKPGTCPAASEIKLENTDKIHEKMAIDGSFEVKKTLGWYAGMQGGGKTTKHAYIGLANYEGFRLGSFGVKPPKNEGEVLVVIDFSSEAKKADVSEQKAVYRSLTLSTDSYPPGLMQPKAVDVVIYKGGISGGRSILTGSGRGQGEAVLTKLTDDNACGTLDITGNTGASIKGTFSTEIVKDLWAK